MRRSLADPLALRLDRDVMEMSLEELPVLEPDLIVTTKAECESALTAS